MYSEERSCCVFLFDIQNIELENLDSNYIQNKLCDNLRLNYISSFLKENKINVKNYNSNFDDLDINKIVKIIKKEQALMVVFSVNYLGLTSNIKDTFSYIKKIKKYFNNLPIFLEGSYSSVNYKEILEKYYFLIDGIIVGDSEEIVLKLTKNFLSGIKNNKIDGLATIKNKKINFIKNEHLTDINKIPFPDRSNLNKVIKSNGIIQIQTSRGCPSNCNFCFLNKYYKISSVCCRRERSPENVLNEIKKTISKSCNEIWFSDEDFIGLGEISQKRILTLSKLIFDNKIKVKLIGQISARNTSPKIISALKKAGLRRLFIGIESSSQSFLNFLNKNLNIEQIKKTLNIVDTLGVFCEIGFIMFYQKTSIASLKEDVNFLKKECLNKKIGYIQIHNLNLLIPISNKQIKTSEINLLNPKIRLIYLATTLFLLKIRNLHNIAREMTVEPKNEKIALKLNRLNNTIILDFLDEIIICAEKKTNLKKIERKIFDIVDKKLIKILNETKKIIELN